MRIRLPVVSIGLLLLGSAPSFAFDPDIRYGADYRVRPTAVSSYPVDEFGDTLGQNTYGTERLRIAPVYRYSETITIGGEIDFLSGQSFGQVPQRGTGHAVFPGNIHNDFTKNVDPRHLWVEWQTGAGLLRAGQMGSHWGLGIFANDGEGRDTVWGDAYFGDIVERVLFATKPFLSVSPSGPGRDIILAVGADLVYRDQLGSLLDGDRAYQGVFSALYAHEGVTGGFYLAYRDQRYGNGDTLQGAGYDLYGQGTIPVGSIGGETTLAGEGVVLQGTSTHFLTEGGAAGVDILGAGAVVRAGLGIRRFGLAITAEAGYASGDNNPYDSTFRTFSFNPDYNVGLILYKDVLAAVSAVGADRAGDPSKVGYPPSGIEKLPTNGAVRNSFYVFPTVSYMPADTVLINIGFLSAWVDSPFEDPYLTFAAGGVPRTYRNVYPPSPHLGYEFDGSARYTTGLGGLPLRLAAGVQYGYFIPGRAFEDAQGDRGPDVQKVQLRLDLLW